MKNTSYTALYILVVLLAVGVFYDSYKLMNTDYPTTTISTNSTTTPTQATISISNSNPNTNIHWGYEASSASQPYEYQNTVYGLSLNYPTSWSNHYSNENDTIVAGVNAHTINFYRDSKEVFVINAFTKENWNKIRTQEFNSNENNIGEGTYIGENETYIFSIKIYSIDIDVQSILSNLRFY